MEDVETKFKGHTHREIISIDDLPLFQEVGSRHGVKVSVIVKEGQEYNVDTMEPSSKYKTKVPEGKVGVEISSEKSDISDFRRDLREVRRK